ncbi:dihydrofolate reductase family protein [Flavilitoribacter nigricans]|uniref:Dihydrofolate reductase n=1 Tax=Flavilitoribacter nigricans (strain ATCC 23147 / DSM 23189 / NBRC 102662 / NCIMB 1420 / SS-2) TaxID=1122177 RepID=A0A2D0MYM4_FLAN2|nr:dihydrofolate reductase family protein [Flavilitoribacter nigricans]PHN01381.1 dihydrofolate reductase [Flavilitoribacter nigricans DSM 23189 = NBRC 102662]
MRKVISFMHISLDGIVSGPNGELNWAKVDEELFDHVGQRINDGDTALYGRVTYQMMEAYWPTAADQPNATKHDIDHSKWYKEVHKVVLSKSLQASDLTNTEIISDQLVDRINALKQQPGEDILVFGSPTATRALMRENLIDGYWLFVNPVILGQGTPLFADRQEKVNLKLLSTRQFASGVTELNYIVE